MFSRTFIYTSGHGIGNGSTSQYILNKHSTPRLSTPSKGVDDCNTEIVSINKAVGRLRKFSGRLVEGYIVQNQ